MTRAVIMFPYSPHELEPGVSGEGGRDGFAVEEREGVRRRWRREEKVRKVVCGCRRKDLPRLSYFFPPLMVSLPHPSTKKKQSGGYRSIRAALYHSSSIKSAFFFLFPFFVCACALLIASCWSARWRGDGREGSGFPRLSRVKGKGFLWPQVSRGEQGGPSHEGINWIDSFICKKWWIDGEECERRGCCWCSSRCFTPRGQVGWNIQDLFVCFSLCKVKLNKTK